MQYKLYFLKLRVKSLKKNVSDSELLKQLKLQIRVSGELYNHTYICEKTKDKYFFTGPNEKDEFFYLSGIKKQTSVTTRNIDNQTTAISHSKADTDDLARFVIDFRNNIICYILKGHFGTTQFKESLRFIFREALILEDYEIYFDDISSQPLSYNLENIEDKIKNLKIKSIELNVEFSKTEELTSSSGLSETFIMKNKLDIPLENVESILSKINEYKDKECCINLKLQDTNGHSFTVSNVPKLGLSFTISASDDNFNTFKTISKDGIDDYLKLYF